MSTTGGFLHLCYDMTMIWDKESLATALRCLNTSKSVSWALEKMKLHFKETITSSQLRKAFARHGYVSPKWFLDMEPAVTFTMPTDPSKVMINLTVGSEQHSLSSFSMIDDMKNDTIKKIIVCPDAHHPYVDKKAWNCFLSALKEVRPDVLVIIGDFVDLLSVSSHAKKASDEKKLAKEIAAGNKALDQICALNIPRVVYIFGNHESRLARYLNANAPELDELLTLEEKFRLKERGIEYVKYGDFLRIGKMAFTHDVGRVGVNTARQSLQDFGDNICVGHSHRASTVYSGSVEGKTHVGLNVGWLGDYNAIDYRNRHTAKREWQHGFGLVYQDKKGVSYCNFVPIINGSCIVDGKLVNDKG